MRHSPGSALGVRGVGVAGGILLGSRISLPLKTEVLKSSMSNRPFGRQIGELRDRLEGIAECIASSRISFQRQKSIIIKQSEELFVESEEMEIYSQTGPTFPEFDRRHDSTIVNGHHFLTSIFLPIRITHIVQFELCRVVQIENEVP
jgi:hypothetical protein